jgi:hypothetical protein
MVDWLQSADPNFTLFSAPAIPTTSPYNTATRTYAQVQNPAGPAGVVSDWVLIQIRDAADPSIILESRSLLVKPNGSVVDVTGGLPVFENRPADVQVAVFHRNHLAVMSNPVEFIGTQVNYDFTTGLSQAFRVDPGDPNPMVQVNGRWCMWLGEFQADGLVDGLDFSPTQVQFNQTLFDEYLYSDFNFDGVSDGLDVSAIISVLNQSVYNFQIYY